MSRPITKPFDPDTPLVGRPKKKKSALALNIKREDYKDLKERILVASVGNDIEEICYRMVEYNLRCILEGVEPPVAKTFLSEMLRALLSSKQEAQKVADSFEVGPAKSILQEWIDSGIEAGQG